MSWLLLADGKEFIRGKWKMGCLFLLFFAVFTGISLYVFTLSDKENQKLERIQIGIVNYDTSEYSKLLLSFFDGNEAVQNYVEIQHGTKEELETLLLQNKLQVLLIVPENFVQDMIKIENTPLQILLNIEDKTKALLMKNLLEGYEKFVSAVEINCVTLYEIMEQDGLPRDLIDRKNVEISLALITTIVNKNDLFTHLEVNNLKRIPLVIFYLHVIFLLLTMYLAAGCGEKILREQRTGLFARLLSTGIVPSLFYLEKSLLFMIVSFVPGFFYYFTQFVLSKGTFPIEGFLLWIVVALFFSVFSFFLSGFFKSGQQYLTAFYLIVFFLTVLGGGIIPFLYLPESMAKIAEKTPLYWIVKQMNSLVLGEMPVEFWNVVKVLLVGSILFWFAGIALQKGKGRKSYEEL